MSLERGVKILNVKYSLNLKVGFAKLLISPSNLGARRRLSPYFMTCTCPTAYDECHGPNATANFLSFLGPAKASLVLGKTKAGLIKKPVQADPPRDFQGHWAPS
jgi:hypothetical protein